MLKRWPRTALWVVSLVLAYLAGRHTAAPHERTDDVRVASFRGGAVTAKELEWRLASMPAVERARYATPEGRRKLLDLILRTELFAAAAERKGLDRDPALRTAMRRALADRFIAIELNERALGASIGDEALRRAYRESLTEFQRPERARAFLIYLDAPAEPGAPRKTKREYARTLLERIKAGEPSEARVFERLAREKSQDPVSRAADGDLGLVTREQVQERWGAPVADALFALQTPGSLSEVVELERGFVLLKLGHREPAISRPFEQVREVLRGRLVNHARARGVEERLRELSDELQLVVHEDVLRTLQLPPTSGATASP